MARLFRRVGVRSKDDVFLLDMGQPGGDRDFWAFTDADWYRWAESGEGKPPRWLVQVAEIPPPPPGSDRDARLEFVASGAFSAGEYVGRTEEDVTRWLAGRRVLGRLSGEYGED